MNICTCTFAGDFAVLLNSGLSLCRALLFNFISSLSAMAGLYVGLAISTHEETRTWIVAITAGMFLYIALVDLVSFFYHVGPRSAVGSASDSRARDPGLRPHSFVSPSADPGRAVVSY